MNVTTNPKLIASIFSCEIEFYWDLIKLNLNSVSYGLLKFAFWMGFQMNKIYFLKGLITNRSCLKVRPHLVLLSLIDFYSNCLPQGLELFLKFY